VPNYTQYCTPNNLHQIKATRTILSLKAGNAVKQAIRWHSLSSQSAAEHNNSLATSDRPDTIVWITMIHVLGQTRLATWTSSRNWESNRASLQDTCFISIHWEASWSVLNSTKAKPRDAPTQMDQHNVVLKPDITHNSCSPCSLAVLLLLKRKTGINIKLLHKQSIHKSKHNSARVIHVTYYPILLLVYTSLHSAHDTCTVTTCLVIQERVPPLRFHGPPALVSVDAVEWHHSSLPHYAKFVPYYTIIPPDVKRKKFSTFVFSHWPWSISPMLRYWISSFVPCTLPVQYLHCTHMYNAHVHKQHHSKHKLSSFTYQQPCLNTTAVISSPSSITTKKNADWKTWYTKCVTSILASKTVCVYEKYLSDDCKAMMYVWAEDSSFLGCNTLPQSE